MIIWAYLKLALVWTWRCARAWLEVGRRLRQIELELQQQTNVRNADVERLESAISAVAESERNGLQQVRHRLEELSDHSTERIAALDATLQNRVDEWARQLSGQMNQLYAAVARAPIEIKDR